MTWLSDAAVARLRDAAELPDFSGTRRAATHAPSPSPSPPGAAP